MYFWTSKPQLFHHVSIFCVQFYIFPGSGPSYSLLGALLGVGGWVGTDATDARVFSSGTTQGNEPKKEFNETPSTAKINFQSHLWPGAV